MWSTTEDVLCARWRYAYVVEQSPWQHCSYSSRWHLRNALDAQPQHSFQIFIGDVIYVYPPSSTTTEISYVLVLLSPSRSLTWHAFLLPGPPRRRPLPPHRQPAADPMAHQSERLPASLVLRQAHRAPRHPPRLRCAPLVPHLPRPGRRGRRAEPAHCTVSRRPRPVAADPASSSGRSEAPGEQRHGYCRRQFESCTSS